MNCNHCKKEVVKIVGHGLCRNCYNKLRSKGELSINQKKCLGCHKFRDIYAKNLCRKCYDKLRERKIRESLTEEQKEEIRRKGRERYKQNIDKIRARSKEKREKEIKELMGSSQIKEITEEKKNISKQKIDKVDKEVSNIIETGEKEISKNLKREIFKKRTKIIKHELSFYSDSFWKEPPLVLKNDIYVRDKKIDELFEDVKWIIRSPKGYRLSSINNRLYIPDNKSRKELNNERVIKKYFKRNECEKLSEIISKLGLNVDLSRRIKQISIELLGKNNYEKMIKEFRREWNKGKDINGYGNALNDFFNRKIDEIRKKTKNKYSKAKNCYYCGKKFYPSIIDSEFLKYYPIKNSVQEVDFCSACLASAFWGIYKGYKTKKEMLMDIKNLINSLGYIPNQSYFRNVNFVRNIPQDKFHNVIVSLIKIVPFSENNRAFKFPEDYPKKYRLTYKKVFGTWFKSLLLAGVLEGYVRETKRGTFCLAEDGHLCLSMKEKDIDDWLSRNSLKHQKEPKYPIDKELNSRGNMRGDCKVGEVYIEYFGLQGTIDYDKKTEVKMTLCKKHNLKLIKIYQEDLINLDKKLAVLLKIR